MRHIYSDAHAAANVAATPGRHCKLMHDYVWRFAACPALCRCFSMKFARRTLCAHSRLTCACNAPMHGSSGALPLFLHEIRTRHALHPRQPDARMQSAYARHVRRFAVASPWNSLAPRLAPKAVRRARTMRLCTARPALCRCFSTKFAPDALRPWQYDVRMQSAYARLVRRFAANPMRTLRRTDYLHSACACTADPLTTPYMTLFTAARVSLPVAQPSVPSSFSLSALQSS